MKNENYRLWASIIDSITKIGASVALILGIGYLIFLVQSGRIVSVEKINTPVYKLCRFLIGDEIGKQLTEKSNELQLALQESDIDLVPLADTTEINLLGKVDTIQTPLQTDLSSQLSVTERELSKVTGKSKIKRGWVYYGAQDNDSKEWKTRYFYVDGDILDKGAICLATQDLNLRDSPPRKEGGVWKKGKIIGGIWYHSFFEILSIQEIPGTGNRTLFWIEVLDSGSTFPLE